MVDYPFLNPTSENGYRVFPSDLEDDQLVVFHGTALCNLNSILEGGFRPKCQGGGVSFARGSELALGYAAARRGPHSPDGVVLAARLHPGAVAEIVIENSTVDVYKLELMPTIIGMCVIPAAYQHR
jgi:hypothetical protein